MQVIILGGKHFSNILNLYAAIEHSGYDITEIIYDPTTKIGKCIQQYCQEKKVLGTITNNLKEHFNLVDGIIFIGKKPETNYKDILKEMRSICSNVSVFNTYDRKKTPEEIERYRQGFYTYWNKYGKKKKEYIYSLTKVKRKQRREARLKYMIESNKTQYHKVCLHCKKEYIAFYNKSKYCSWHCSRFGRKVRVVRRCWQCGKRFKVIPAKKKIFCSRECYQEYDKLHHIRITHRKIKPYWGGKIPNSGRWFGGWFKNLYFSNTNKLAFFVYNIHHQNMMYKNRRAFKWKNENGSIIKIIPAFVDKNGIFYDILDYKNLDNRFKNRYKGVADEGEKIVKITRKEIHHMKRWCVNHYKVKVIQDLYSKRGSIFLYSCSFCQKRFIRRGEVVDNRLLFCSHKCRAKYFDYKKKFIDNI